jgi:hypothetical protein
MPTTPRNPALPSLNSPTRDHMLAELHRRILMVVVISTDAAMLLLDIEGLREGHDGTGS